VPSDKASVIKKAYEIYGETNLSSLSDVLNYFRDNNIDINNVRKDGTKTNMDRSHIS